MKLLEVVFDSIEKSSNLKLYQHDIDLRKIKQEINEILKEIDIKENDKLEMLNFIDKKINNTSYNKDIGIYETKLSIDIINLILLDKENKSDTKLSGLRYKIAKLNNKIIDVEKPKKEYAVNEK